MCESKCTQNTLTVQERADYLHLPVAFLSDTLMLRDVPDPEHGNVIAIPYGHGCRKQIRYPSAQRFGWQPYDRRRIAPYGEFCKYSNPTAWADRDYLTLVEGASDCWCLWHHDFPTLGIPGATQFDRIELRHVERFSTVYLHRELDDGGGPFISGTTRRLREIGYRSNVLEFSVATLFPDCKDPADLHRIYGPERFADNFESALATAEPAADFTLPWDRPRRVSSGGPAPEGFGALPRLVAEDLGEPDSRGRWCCPFHDDHRPSMDVSAKGQNRPRYRCWSCQASGDARDWLVNHRRMTEAEALRLLDVPRKPLPCKAEPAAVPDGLITAHKAIRDIDEYLDPIELSFCPRPMKLGFSERADTSHKKVVVAPCQRLNCPHCRGKWNNEKIGEMVPRIEAHQGPLYIVSPEHTANWETVRKRIARADGAYMAVKDADGHRLVLCTCQVQDSKPIDHGAAVEAIVGAIKAVQSGTKKPVYWSDNWPAPQWRTKEAEAAEARKAAAANFKNKYKLEAHLKGPLAEILGWLRDEGIEVRHGRWSALDMEHYSFATDKRDVWGEMEGMPEITIGRPKVAQPAKCSTA